MMTGVLEEARQRSAGDGWMGEYRTGGEVLLFFGAFKRRRLFFFSFLFVFFFPSVPEAEPQPRLSIAIPVMKRSDAVVRRCSANEPRILSSVQPRRDLLWGDLASRGRGGGGVIHLLLDFFSLNLRHPVLHPRSAAALWRAGDKCFPGGRGPVFFFSQHV